MTKVWILCVALLVVSQAAADADPTPSPEAALSASDVNYQGLIAEALAEFDARHWAEARLLFEQAHAVRPSARTLRGLGMVDFNLGIYARAVVELEVALDDPRQPLDATLREQVRGLLERAARYVSRVRVVARPREMVLTVDGGPAAIDREGHLVLTLGTHHLRAVAAGYQNGERMLNVNLPAPSSIELSLSSEPLPILAAPTSNTAPVASTLANVRVWAWLTTVLTPLALGAATTSWLLADAKYAELEHRCARMPCFDHVPGGDTVQRLDRTSHVLWGVGGALGVSALVMWTLEGTRARAPEQHVWLPRWPVAAAQLSHRGSTP
ncbi:MAG: hypothetical protein QM778_22475 [Myxococcales bacterium]